MSVFAVLFGVPVWGFAPLWIVLAAGLAYAGLPCTWGLVAVRTARGSMRGSPFAPTPNAGPVRAKKDAPTPG